LEVHLRLPERLPTLSAALEVTTYRMTQEAMTNIVKHAQAETVWIRLWVADQQLRLEVEDDGIGLPHHLAHGVGLNSMRERAAELGGTFSVEQVGRHTRISAMLPLPQGDVHA
jgi:signal transduction histidine kinase